MVSSEYWIWDREWHVEFTGSLRAQHMPFRNVFEPWKTLRYHMAGDVAASVLQSLSFVAMNASRALSYAHDLQSLTPGRDGRDGLPLDAAAGRRPPRWRRRSCRRSRGR